MTRVGARPSIRDCAAAGERLSGSDTPSTPSNFDSSERFDAARSDSVWKPRQVPQTGK
jgi:hypothetical protein